ncbi:MAG: DegT/DnrJ/EryC1/StrS family aminotransferase, partial [Planctomycetota bacterium]|nr:DegT/DnrJ/EryC1/StrS family aminotransferase [Planctomycetota bacterium]
LPEEPPDSFSVFYRYVFRHPLSDKIISRLRRCGIEAKKPVYKPLHHYLTLDGRNFPVAERVHQSIVSLPIYPSLTDRQVDYIIDNLSKILTPIIHKYFARRAKC